MSDNEAHMLQRGSTESSRLETQHEFVKALAHGRLIHPCTQTLSLRAIVDVDTGTGAWLKDVAQALDHHHHHHPELEFIGFASQISRLEFLVQDMTIPFDKRHHEHFD